MSSRSFIIDRNGAIYKALRKKALETQGKPSTVYGLTYSQQYHSGNLAYLKSLFQHYRRNLRWDLLVDLCHEMNVFQDKVWDDKHRNFQGKVFSEKAFTPDKITKHHNIQTADGIIIQNLILSGFSSKFVNVIGIGIGLDDAAAGNVTLSNEVTRLPTNRDGWHVPAADILNTGVIFGHGTPTNIYTEMGGFTGMDALEDFLAWRVLFPPSGYINHTIGQTIILLNHIQETIALS